MWNRSLELQWPLSKKAKSLFSKGSCVWLFDWINKRKYFEEIIWQNLIRQAGHLSQWERYCEYWTQRKILSQIWSVEQLEVCHYLRSVWKDEKDCFMLILSNMLLIGMGHFD